MQEKYFMKKWELICIVLNLAVYKTVTGYSRIFADISGSSATLTAIFSGAAAFLIIWLLLTLREKRGNRTILDISGERLGKCGQYVLLGILFAYFICSAIVNLRETGEFIKAVSFPTAPLSFVFFILVLTAVLCCAQGFDSLGRAHSVVVPILIFAVVAIAVFSLAQGEVSNLFPLLGYGAENTFLKGLSTIGLYGDLIILFLLVPFSESKTNFKKTALVSVGAGVLINIFIVLACTAVTPYTVSKTIQHPFHQLVKLFSAGRILQRIDGYFMYLTAMCSILSLALNIFFASFSAGQVLRLPKTRPLSYPLGMLIIFGSLAFDSRETAYMWAKNYLWIWFAVIFTLTALVLILPKRRGIE